jgi:serine/threonine-protein kinase
VSTGTLAPNDWLIGQYRIIKFIGEGGTGEVYLAENETAGRKVALKILKPMYSRDQAFLNLMRRELLQGVNDPAGAVVQYFDLLKDNERDGIHFLVMEFIDGPSLADLMAKGPVKPEILMAIGRRAAQGLRSAHKKKVFHRDISPDNILLRDGDPDQATLIDFGIAKDLRPTARTVIGDGFAGKYEYAAPEQLDGDVDERSDLYSLGATLLAAARGKVPELPPRRSEIEKMKHDRLDIAGIPKPLADLIDRMTDPDPRRRVQSASELLRLFDADGPEDEILDPAALLDVDDVSPVTTTRPGRKGRKKGLGGALVWAVLTVLLAVGGGVAWQMGWIDEALKPRLPLADPYRFSAEFGTPATVTGDAPTEEARAELLAAIEEVSGAAPTAAIRLADGVPTELWAAGLAAAIRGAEPLQQLRVEVIGQRLIVKGLASSQRLKDEVTEALQKAARLGGLTLDTNIRVLVQPLALSALSAALQPMSRCGPLRPGKQADPIPPDADIQIEGMVTSDQVAETLRKELQAIAEGRDLALNLTVANPFVCRIVDVLAPQDGADMRFAYTLAATGQVNNTNDFRPDDIPIIDLMVPADMGGHVAVFLSDNEGAVLHLMPYQERPEHRLSEVGRQVGGRRQIRVAFAPGDPECPQACALSLANPPFGISFVYAVVTDEPLFRDMRFRVENVEDFAPALSRAISQAVSNGSLRGVAMRMIRVRER